jgi:hypothetical protein
MIASKLIALYPKICALDPIQRVTVTIEADPKERMHG